MAVNKLTDGPLQCQMPASAALSSLGMHKASGRVLVRHPNDKSPTSFTLIELSEQNSVHCREISYFRDGSSPEAKAETIAPRFDCHWSEGVNELERQARSLQPDLGKAADRELAVEDLSELYEGMHILTIPRQEIY